MLRMGNRLAVSMPLLLAVAASASGRAPALGQEQNLPGFKEFVRPVLNRGAPGTVFFPGRYVGGQIEEILDPTGVAVHLTRADEPGEELVFPAGKPFITPGAWWRIWLESDWAMSPVTLHAALATRPRGIVWKRMPLVAAGRIIAPPGLARTPNAQLWLLYAESPYFGHPNELSRRRGLAQLGDGLLMPEGMALAGMRDDRDGGYLALSRPFNVVAGTTQPAPLEMPPADQSWLLTYVRRADRTPVGSLAETALAVSQHEDRVPPDVKIVTDTGIYCVWYHLSPGTAVVAGGSQELYLESRALELPAGKIETLDATLLKRPVLDVSLVLPPLVREKPFSLGVRKLPERELLAEAELSRDAGRFRFQDGLVHGILEVVLTTHVGSFSEQVDMIGLEEGFVGLEPDLIEIYGTVRRGGEPHAATLTFKTSSGSVEAVADESGRYRAFALAPIGLASLVFEGVRQEPWQRMYVPPIRESHALDFDIPDADVSVHVVDASTGEPILGATVAVRNEFEPPPAANESSRDHDDPRMQMIGRSHLTDGDGVVHLPPPRPGRIRLTASAESYAPMEEPLDLEVPDPPQSRDVVLRLERAKASVQMYLRLPDGSPAVGAEVLRVPTIPWDKPSFSGRADSHGIISVPAEPSGGLLLLRHPDASFAIVEWRDRRPEEPVKWSFSPAAPPLTVRVLNPSGDEAAAFAEIALWVGGRKLMGSTLHWLVGTRGMSDSNGFWVARQLPTEPVRVLAWNSGVQWESRSGGLDTLAREIAFPWPVDVQVRAVQ